MNEKFVSPGLPDRAAPRRGFSWPSASTEDDPDAVDADVSNAFACVRGQRNLASVIELRFLDPNEPDRAFEYSLRRETQWDKAGGVIVIEFVDGVRAAIRGIGLYDLKERILRRMVAWVQEQGDDPVAMKAAEQDARARGTPFVWVTAIEVKTPA